MPTPERIHPVLRLRADQAVNFIPDLAVVESYVRAVDGQAADVFPSEFLSRYLSRVAGLA